jgi:hypothetical protein
VLWLCIYVIAACYPHSGVHINSLITVIIVSLENGNMDLMGKIVLWYMLMVCYCELAIS